MFRRITFFVLLFVSLISACAPATEFVPTATVSLMPSLTATITLTPTHTLTSTETPDPNTPTDYTYRETKDGKTVYYKDAAENGSTLRYHYELLTDANGNELFRGWFAVHVRGGTLLDGTAMPLIVADAKRIVPASAPMIVEFEEGINGPFIQLNDDGHQWEIAHITGLFWNDLEVLYYKEKGIPMPSYVGGFVEDFNDANGLTFTVITDDGEHEWNVRRSFPTYISRSVDWKWASEDSRFWLRELSNGKQFLFLPRLRMAPWSNTWHPMIQLIRYPKMNSRKCSFLPLHAQQTMEM